MTDLDTKRSTTASAFEVLSRFVPWPGSAMLRGGRVTKFKGQPASYSPELGLADSGISPVIPSPPFGLLRNLLRWTAAPMALATATVAHAQAQDACVQPDPVNQPDVWVCEDNGAPATATQNVSGTVLLEDGFQVDTSGTVANGLAANATDSGLTVIQAEGISSIIGALDGIRARNEFYGAITLTTGDVTGLNASGIRAFSYQPGTDLTIDSSAGTVSGGTDGIYAINQGAGFLSITTANVEGGRNGIYAKIDAYDLNDHALTIDSSGGEVVGRGRHGILALNRSVAGDTTVTADQVTGERFSGILAIGSGTGRLSVSANDVSGRLYGIQARSYAGTIEITLGSGGTVVGETAAAIRANSTGAAAHITIDGMGTNASGGMDGLVLDTNGADISVSNFASITGNAGDGIDAISSGGDITITDIGTVLGDGGNGIFVYAGTGDISIQGVGLDGGVTGTGIGSVSVGGTSFFEQNGSGIFAVTDGSIDIGSEASIGNVTGRSIGIRTQSSEGLIINSSQGEVTGAFFGILANNLAGAVDITTANVTGAYGLSISNSGTELSIDSRAGNVIGNQTAIMARNYGTGALSIMTGRVESMYSTGIYALNHGADLLIDSSQGNVEGRYNAIVARNNGSGTLSITSADVEGGNVGIGAYQNGNGAGDLAIVANNVSGGRYGIITRDGGMASGAQTIVANDVTATGNAAIFANASGSSLTITTTGSVSGNNTGIDARNSGTGALTITAADVTGTGSTGIFASNAAIASGRYSPAGTDLTITTSGTVSGATGIFAVNRGSRELEITTTGVEGTSGSGIRALNYGTDLSIVTGPGQVSGYDFGIFAINGGSGSLSITTHDVEVTATSASGVSGGLSGGLYALNTGTDLRIDTSNGDVSGLGFGILAFNRGSGEISIVTRGASATYGSAIIANNYGTSLTIDSRAGELTGSSFGILAFNAGSGALTIDVHDVTGGAVGIQSTSIDTTTTITVAPGADVVGSSAQGIFASSRNAAADVTVTGMDSTVAGGTDGIVIETMGADIVVSGFASVTGNGGVGLGDGIRATSDGGDISIDGIGTVVGSGRMGIHADAGSGNISIQGSGLAGDITGAANGIFATTSLGSIDIGGQQAIGNVTGTAGDGIEASVTGGTGDIIIGTSNGAVAGGLFGINASNFGSGATTITTADVSTVAAVGVSGDIAINTVGGRLFQDAFAYSAGAGDISITTADAGSIFAFNTAAGGGIEIDTTRGIVRNPFGISAIGRGSGAVTVTTGRVDGTVSAVATGGGVTVDTSQGEVNASGRSYGVRAQEQGTGAAAAPLRVTTAGVEADERAITLLSLGGDIFLDTSRGSVTGGSYGIISTSRGAGATNLFVGDTTGDATGIFVESNTGNISAILAPNATVTGTTGQGISANASGGAIAIGGSSSGAVIGGTSGIEARSAGGDISVSDLANVTANAGDGIDAVSGGENIAITGIGSILGTGGNGIFADAASGDISIQDTGLAGGITGTGSGDLLIGITPFAGINGSGIVALAGGSIDIGGIAAIGTVTSQNAAGIFARSGAGMTLDTSASYVAGGAFGIFASNGNSGALTITTGLVTGSVATGIAAYNRGADLTIDSTAGAVFGGQSGIVARNYSDISSLSVTTGAVRGETADGIIASNSGSDLIVDSTEGEVRGGTFGMVATNFGTGLLSITTAHVTGDLGSAISAFNSGTGTDLVIDSQRGNVYGRNSGLVAANSGSGSLSISTASVTSLENTAIFASNLGTDLVIDTAGGTVSGAAGPGFSRAGGITALNYGTGSLSIVTANVVAAQSRGIYALNNGTGLTVDTSAGDVTAQSYGIVAIQRGSGQLSITTRDVTSSSATGVAALASGNGGGDIAITNNGRITGAYSGIFVSNDSGGNSTIVNNGTLLGGVHAVSADTINTGDVAIENFGTIAGSVSLGIGDDTITNRTAGLFFATADSNFGDGTDVFENFGTFAVDGNVAMTGLEQFNNRNLLTMVDGAANDSLTLSGGYLAASDLALDIDWTAGMADVLIVGGDVSGITTLSLNQISTATTFGQRIRVVDAGAGTSQDAFVLASGSLSASPFQTLALEFDSTAGDFSVYRAVTPRVFEATKLAEAAQALWYRSADAWSDHRANARFASDGEPLWLTVYSAISDRDETFSDPTGFATGEAVLDYSQDYFGIQAGADLALGETLVFGLTAGYLSSNMKLAANGNGAKFGVFNLGVSSSYRKGGFFADALVKYDFISGELRDPVQGGFTGNLDGNAYGGHLGLGYRVDGEGFYIQPHASVEFQKSDLDDLFIDVQSFEFDEMNGLRAIAGLRAGGRTTRSVGTILDYYLDASAVKELEGEGKVRFLTGGDLASFTNNRIDTYAHLEAGLNLHGNGPISGFFQVEGDISGDYTSIGGRAGFRLAF